MANKQIVFGDRLVGISIQNGLVRMDLAVVAGTGKGKDDKPVVKLETSAQVVMPLEGFVQATGMQDKLVRELVAREKKRVEDKKGKKDGEAAAPAA